MELVFRSKRVYFVLALGEQQEDEDSEYIDNTGGEFEIAESGVEYDDPDDDPEAFGFRRQHG